MADLASLWDHDDAAGSLDRLRAAAELAEGTERLVLLTQVARALGLLERFEEAHGVLDHLALGDPEVAARVSLERGRLLRSAGRPDEAAPHFAGAEQVAARAGLDALAVDAVHMQALVADPADRVAVNERALALAAASDDPVARRWDASLLHNIGMAHADTGDFTAALASFEQALAARERQGDPDGVHVARWMVAWALRNVGRTAEALDVQRSLKAELDAAGREDPHVDEELALLEGATPGST
jgi:tetratricopeptide (TPR) repeat protein